MAYQNSYKKTERTPSQRRSMVFDLITEGGAKELSEEADRTAIKYIDERENEWLKNLTADGTYEGISSGYPGVDSVMGSFLPGELFTIGGDTGHGKSLFAMNIAMNVYKKYVQPVLMVNLELTEEQAWKRFWSISSEIHECTFDEKCLQYHDKAGVMVQATSAVNYNDIDILMKKAKQEGACLVIIDHLHFFNDSLGDNQASVLARIMKHFKECAVENELPVILLSHVTLTKKLDKNSGEETTLRPDLHSLRGSKSIEQTSDMVGFVYRDPEDTSQMEFYLRKNRSRALDTRSVKFQQTDWKLDQTWPPNLNSKPLAETPSEPTNEYSEKPVSQQLSWADEAAQELSSTAKDTSNSIGTKTYN